MNHPKHAAYSKWKVHYGCASRALRELRVPKGNVVETEGLIRNSEFSTCRHTLDSLNARLNPIPDGECEVGFVSETPIGRLQHEASSLLTAVILVTDNNVPNENALNSIIETAPKLIKAIEDTKTQIAENSIVGPDGKDPIVSLGERKKIESLLGILGNATKWFATSAEGELNYKHRNIPWKQRIGTAVKDQGNVVQNNDIIIG